ncbi:MAG: TonB-dependent receptor [Saprospiraceae bacterium]|nr:TonB-dependent receptor [Saprospiraceae bacterium]
MQRGQRSNVILFLGAFLILFSTLVQAQDAIVYGEVRSLSGQALGFANVGISGTALGTSSDEEGFFLVEGLAPGSYRIMASFLGYESMQRQIELQSGDSLFIRFDLDQSSNTMDEVVVTGTLRAVKRLESPVPVEVYTPAFFRKNPTPNIYEALQNVNGVRPQLNCQVCNTGDIHINGLEGPYSMVLIDGMPIVSSLATVYGLSGIPNSLVERMEIVKGPASSLYGSEAIGGLINIITKKPENAPLFSADLMRTSWSESNVDLGARVNVGNVASVLTGLNYFHYGKPIDNNQDNFTDLTIQERVSVFQKWNFQRAENRLFTMAGRYYWEDRWGGELDWTPSFRGGDEVYGEAITTKRWELLGQYELPMAEKMLFSFSLNGHQQNSVYGDIPYVADQKIGFGQVTWDKKISRHNLLMGSALRYTYYDDNTPATGGDHADPKNSPVEIWLPGVFVQDEIRISPKQNLLVGLRYDHNNVHGNIFTPRLAYKWSITNKDIFRLNMGTGFRVVNLFTEDHAALTGAREVVIMEALKPERSLNISGNYTRKLYLQNGASGSLELSSWYTHFSNVILPDYDSNPTQIIYDNLDGSAVTKGISVNADLTLPSGLSFILGASLLDVSKEEGDIKERQILTERFSGTWALSYKFHNNAFAIDYTGNAYSPMKLPLAGPLDLRPAESPWWSIQNIQFSYKGWKGVELYAGVKNILNWTPWKNQAEPIIARAFDPFDRQVAFDAAGDVIPTADNPQALTFDPSYVYAPNQGIRAFFGLRYSKF